MKRSTCLFVFLGILFLPALLPAQDFKVPNGYSFTTPNDFRRYKSDILRCIEYLESAPLDANFDDRREADKFLITWAQGNPDLQIELLPYVGDLVNGNEELLPIYIGGWVRQMVVHPEAAGRGQCHRAALMSVLTVVKNGRGINSTPGILELLKQDRDGTLEDWMQQKLQ